MVWNIPLGFNNDHLMALMSLHRALLHMDLVEGRGGGGRGKEREGGEKGKQGNVEKDGVRCG